MDVDRDHDLVEGGTDLAATKDSDGEGASDDDDDDEEMNYHDGEEEDGGEYLHVSGFFFHQSIDQLFPPEGCYGHMELKPDYRARPLLVFANGSVILEAFSPLAEQAMDFLVAIAEPVSRPSMIHEYKLTEYSLYAAVSVGLDPKSIVDVLNRLSKTTIPTKVKKFIHQHTESVGRVKMVLKDNHFYVESQFPDSLRTLLRDDVVRAARVVHEGQIGDDFRVEQVAVQEPMFGSKRTKASKSKSKKPLNGAPGTTAKTVQAEQPPQPPPPPPSASKAQPELDEYDQLNLFDMFDGVDDSMLDAATLTALAPQPPADTEEFGDFPAGPVELNIDGPIPTLEDEEDLTEAIETTLHPAAGALLSSFEVRAENVESVRRRCSELGLPVIEEYDFRVDTTLPRLDIDLKASARLRPYQEKSLNKMFGNGRARSGIVVLPCGAGKTLVGVTAACTIKRSCLVLCTSGVSVDQWAREFRSWSTITERQIAKFTSQSKEKFSAPAGVLISTYTMVTFSGKRAYDAQKLMDFICSREWGFLLLDEVHVVPADMFKKVLTIVKAHAKLGLTATLVREDNKISQLNYLIGPKLFEANWLDLAKKGHIANVQCAEVWCEMSKEFFQEYLDQPLARKRQLLQAMNPRKIQSCAFLIDYHESRGDKIIVFSDNVFALKFYANKLGRPFIYGGTSPAERSRILQQFRYNPALNTIFLSKVGDTSIDIPEASVLIQISCHYGSRRQEAQRLGRILRAKKQMGSGYNAFFYTLVSKDTEEVYYSAKRQQFLVDQGYFFKIISKLEGLEATSTVYTELNERLELLATVLVSNLDDDEMDLVEDDNLRYGDDDADEVDASTQAPLFIQRSSNMASLSGADQMAYMEVERGGRQSSRRFRQRDKQ